LDCFAHALSPRNAFNVPQRDNARPSPICLGNLLCG
jgi:hypothetical protein